MIAHLRNCGILRYHPFAVGLLCAIMLSPADCTHVKSGNTPYHPLPLVNIADWHSLREHTGKLVEVQGTAYQTKQYARLNASHYSYRMHDFPSWPDEVRDREVRVVGVLVYTYWPPMNNDNPRRQTDGYTGDEYGLKDVQIYVGVENWTSRIID